jgi:hypothetical protein
LVSATYDVPQEDILGSRRLKTVALARACAMWLARRSTEMSYPQIGAVFNRDHTTVMSGCLAHGKRMLLSPSEKARTEAILHEVLRGDPARREGGPVGLSFHELELDLPAEPFPLKPPVSAEPWAPFPALPVELDMIMRFA